MTYKSSHFTDNPWCLWNAYPHTVTAMPLSDRFCQMHVLTLSQTCPTVTMSIKCMSWHFHRHAPHWRCLSNACPDNFTDMPLGDNVYQMHVLTFSQTCPLVFYGTWTFTSFMSCMVRYQHLANHFCTCYKFHSQHSQDSVKSQISWSCITIFVRLVNI